eukprot:TRINITY_DN33841_c0_g1_i1.p1 TRINITY_DN33841_c0_g1~~TRINITY_DN33841_c0_g1_i1.p1  ORF type:complete len:840 (-),score=214.12 TRINITY_DN33841_c0_g1_i1:52-2571(-)
MRCAVAVLLVAVVVVNVAGTHHRAVQVPVNEDEVSLFGPSAALDASPYNDWSSPSYADVPVEGEGDWRAAAGQATASPSASQPSPTNTPYARQTTAPTPTPQSDQYGRPQETPTVSPTPSSGPNVTLQKLPNEPVTFDGVFYAIKGPAEFTGSSYVEVMNSALPRVTNSMSWAMWITPRERPAPAASPQDAKFFMFIARKGQGAQDRTFGLWMYSGSTRLHARVSTYSKPNLGIDPTEELRLNEGNHVALTLNGRSFKVYIDGDFKAGVDLPDDPQFNTGSLYVGADPFFKNGFKGTLTNFKIFDRELSSEEVKADFDNGLCLNDCSNNGRCKNRVCQCFPGFEGADCSQVAPEPVPIPMEIAKGTGCPNNCNGQGVCFNQQCLCNTGFYGVGCNRTVGCPNDCNGRGECRSGVCFCVPGWEGEDCKEAASEVTMARPDSAKVVRDVTYEKIKFFYAKYQDRMDVTEDELAGWAQPFLRKKIKMQDIEKQIAKGLPPPVITCMNNCTDHGKCKYGECSCSPGWEGEDCSVKSCPNRCNGQGTCVDGRCVCKPGYEGEDCGTLACINDCNDRGMCVNGQCQCDTPYGGVDCSTIAPEGSVEERPGKDCYTILKTQGLDNVTNGQFWIQPDTYPTPFQVYCDFTTQGGGWTLLAKIPSSNDSQWGFNANVWSSREALDLQAIDDSDQPHKSEAYGVLPLKELLVGVKTGRTLNFAKIACTNSFRCGSTLFDLMADGQYRQFKQGTGWWKSLIAEPRPSLVENNVCSEGFNMGLPQGPQCRMGIMTSDGPQTCAQGTSFIGIGCTDPRRNMASFTTGNFCRGRACSAGEVNTRGVAFLYGKP